MLSFLTTVVLVLLALAMVATIFHAARTARTPQGAMGWAIFVLAAPWAALLAYMFLGRHRFTGYLLAHRASSALTGDIRRFEMENAPTDPPTGVNIAPFEAAADLAATGGNRLDLLIDGQAAFDAMFQAIDDARHYVLVQFYILRADDLGRALQQRLMATSLRGVSVRLMVDAVGSHGLPYAYLDELRAAGVNVIGRENRRGPRFRFQLNFRNHRKTVIVDGVTGFTGGLNVGDEYMGRAPATGAWRDTHARLHGPVVTQLQLIFAEDWHWASGETLTDTLRWQAPHAPEDQTALICATGPADVGETGTMMFFSAITAAQDRFWIASPYFVPDIDILTALRNAAMRGVDVRVLVPAQADHYLTWLAAFAYFDEVRAAGVRIFRYGPGFMHQKVFLVDDKIAAVGTTNLDNRSCRLNFETMALVFDEMVAGQVHDMLATDFAQATEIEDSLADQSLLIQFGAPLARLFAPVL